MSKRVGMGVLAVVVAAIFVAACGGSPGESALQTAQKRADKQDAAAAKKDGTGIEAAGDTTASTSTDESGTMSSTDSMADGGMSQDSTGGDTKDDNGGSGDSAPLPASVTTDVVAKGKDLFTTTCGGCHTLKDAGTAGQIGPDLDTLKPGYEHVKDQIDNGGNGMPSGLLKGDDRDATAAYVAVASGAVPAPQ